MLHSRSRASEQSSRASERDHEQEARWRQPARRSSSNGAEFFVVPAAPSFRLGVE